MRGREQTGQRTDSAVMGEGSKERKKRGGGREERRKGGGLHDGGQSKVEP